MRDFTIKTHNSSPNSQIYPNKSWNNYIKRIPRVKTNFSTEQFIKLSKIHGRVQANAQKLKLGHTLIWSDLNDESSKDDMLWMNLSVQNCWIFWVGVVCKIEWREKMKKRERKTNSYSSFRVTASRAATAAQRAATSAGLSSAGLLRAVANQQTIMCLVCSVCICMVRSVWRCLI